MVPPTEWFLPRVLSMQTLLLIVAYMVACVGPNRNKYVQVVQLSWELKTSHFPYMMWLLCQPLEQKNKYQRYVPILKQTKNKMIRTIFDTSIDNRQKNKLQLTRLETKLEIPSIKNKKGSTCMRNMLLHGIFFGLNRVYSPYTIAGTNLSTRVEPHGRQISSLEVLTLLDLN